MLAAALLSVLLVAAPGSDLPATSHHQLPGLSIELLKGEVSRRIEGDEGMIRVRTSPMDQLFYWNKAAGTLRARAEHERGLLAKAASDARAQRIDPITESKTGALSWGAELDETTFRSTVLACGARHVLLTTMGPDARAVDEAHRRSLASLVCG